MKPRDPKDSEDIVQLEFPGSLTETLDALSKDPTNTRLKIEIGRKIRAQRVESVLGIIHGIQLKNKVLIHLLNEYAGPYNLTLLNMEAIKYLDQHTSENTLQRAIDIGILKFKQKEITLFVLLGNIQRIIQDSDAITTAKKGRDSQQ